jgi:oligopeptide/dipeptide ABC transporter ATP-binding protein
VSADVARPAEAAFLDIRGLSKIYDPRPSVIDRLTGRPQKPLVAVDDVSLQIRKGEIFSLVGESGSGKTTLGRTLLRLVEPSRGDVVFRGESLAGLPRLRMTALRRDMQMIFQNPYSSLNPRMTIRQMLAEALTVHHVCPREEIPDRIAALLELVGLSPRHADRLPKDFSGGQRQRIGIARALSVNPAFIVADEPVSAVDVSVQAQIMNLLLDLRDRLDLTLFFIAHDLSVVQYVSTRVGVMYLGRLVEVAPRRALFSAPRHPYTQGLLRAAPRPDPTQRTVNIAISGEPPSPLDPPPGCHFHTRCPLASARCRSERPALAAPDEEHLVACHHEDEAAAQWAASLKRRA